jgi:hypothetical protein
LRDVPVAASVADMDRSVEPGGETRGAGGELIGRSKDREEKPQSNGLASKNDENKIEHSRQVGISLRSRDEDPPPLRFGAASTDDRIRAVCNDLDKYWCSPK